MRTSFLSIALLILLSTPAIAQLHAGEIPSGSSAVDLDIDLILGTSFTQDSATFEIDCDDQPDITAYLIHGAPPVDAPNVAMLHLIDDDIELCMDMAQFQRPKYYDLDQLLDCASDFDWQSNEWNVLGDLGSFTAIGPTSVENLYIAYRRGTDVGWILLSFDVSNNVAVQLQIHQVLPICPTTLSVAAHDTPAVVMLFPNPNNGEPIRVQSAEALRSIEIIDATGRVLEQYGGVVRTIEAPEVAGAYLVSSTHIDGRRSVTRLVRY